MWSRALAPLGGVALLVSLAFPWYESTDGELNVISSEGVAPQLSWTPGLSPDAWSAFTATDAVLAVLAVAAVVLAFVRPALARLAGGAALALVAYRLLWPPGEAADFTLAPAAALALTAAVAPASASRAARGGAARRPRRPLLLCRCGCPGTSWTWTPKPFSTNSASRPTPSLRCSSARTTARWRPPGAALRHRHRAVPFALLALAVPVTALLTRAAKPVAAAVSQAPSAGSRRCSSPAREVLQPGALEADTGR